jgi:hypothetical protein
VVDFKNHFINDGIMSVSERFFFYVCDDILDFLIKKSILAATSPIKTIKAALQANTHNKFFAFSY